MKGQGGERKWRRRISKKEYKKSYLSKACIISFQTLQAIAEVLTVAALFGKHWQQVGLPHPIPIACVGCGDADRVRS